MSAITYDARSVVTFATSPNGGRTYTALTNIRRSRARRGLPASIPASQRYYWSRRWQADEAASVAALEAGEGVEFDSAADLLAWLASNGDD